MAIQTRYIYLLKYILLAVDLLMLNFIYFASYYITHNLGKSVTDEINQHYVVVCNLIWLLSAAFFGLYSTNGTRKLERIYRASWRSVALHFVLFAIYLLFSKDAGFSRTFLVVFYVLLTLAFILNRFIGTTFQYILLNRFHATKKVAVMGSNHTALRVSTYLENQGNFEFCGFIGDDDSIYDDEKGIVSESIPQKLAEVARKGVKDIYVAVAPSRMSEVRGLIMEADKACVRLKFIPDLGGNLAFPYTISYLDSEFPMITLREEPLEEVSNRFKKRAFDLVFSTVVIVFILSWLYPLIALLIKIQDGGPVMFKQLRSGRNDEPFLCYKFRSMQINGESDQKQATKNDNRITPIGRFLRKSNLDEMPQFFNVFRGHMSVVGPRPHMIKHTEQYKAIISQFMVRHFVKPGITGWAQVNGYRGETKEKEDMENRVKFDIHYLENWSAMFDVKIVFLTVINMIRGEENAF